MSSASQISIKKEHEHWHKKSNWKNHHWLQYSIVIRNCTQFFTRGSDPTGYWLYQLRLGFIEHSISKSVFFHILFEYKIVHGIYYYQFCIADSEKLKSLYLHGYSTNKDVKVDALEIIGVTLSDEKTLIDSALLYWDASLDERYIIN